MKRYRYNKIKEIVQSKAMDIIDTHYLQKKM